VKTGGIDEPLQISFSKFLNLNFIFQDQTPFFIFPSRYVAKPKFPSEKQNKKKINRKMSGFTAAPRHRFDFEKTTHFHFF
jgi:hypothetical protein